MLPTCATMTNNRQILSYRPAIERKLPKKGLIACSHLCIFPLTFRARPSGFCAEFTRVLHIPCLYSIAANASTKKAPPAWETEHRVFPWRRRSGPASLFRGIILGDSTERGLRRATEGTRRGRICLFLLEKKKMKSSADFSCGFPASFLMVLCYRRK